MSRRVIIGTAGHIDHGKSALVRALTGVDPDRLKEEKARGITIELGFAHMLLPSGTLAGIVDVPGHERFVRTMVAGAAGIDIVLLVIGVDEGVKPQTREHLDICRLLSIRHGIVVLNKRDRVDDEWAQLQEEEVRAFVRGTFLEDAPVLHVSALTGQGIPELAAAIDRLAATIPGKDPLLPFRLPIDRSFTIKGFGTVVTGTVTGGSIRTGEEVSIQPGGPTARIRGLQVHGTPAEQAEAGNRAAVNLQGIDRENAPRGAVLCRPGDFQPTRSVEAKIEYLQLAARPMKSRERVTFHSGTASTPGRVFLYGRTELPPGESSVARIDFSDPFILMGGDRFILRGFAPLENFGYTLGGGVVLHPHPPRRRGAGRSIPLALNGLGSTDSTERILAALSDASLDGTDERRLCAVAGVSNPVARKTLDRLVASGQVVRLKQANGYRFWHHVAVLEIRSLLLEALSGLHERFPERAGFPIEEIASATARVLDPELSILAIAGDPRAERQGDLVYLPDKRPRSVELTSPLAESMVRTVVQAGLAGLSNRELADATARPLDPRLFEKTLEGLVRERKILKVKELYFDPGSVDALKGRLIDYLASHGEITVPEFKEMAGLSRKYVIPLIEHFDLTKVTLRVGDKRVLRKTGNG
ncbi:MAG TPA: selenocysteine-specific translation elongation factor [Candidatus Deferrimicrobiaceae bacterium]|jgi:selenocysteine-specific elongation factor